MTYSHLQADCLYTGISSGPNARCRVWETFTFTFTSREDLNNRAFAAICTTGFEIVRLNLKAITSPEERRRLPKMQKHNFTKTNRIHGFRTDSRSWGLDSSGITEHGLMSRSTSFRSRVFPRLSIALIGRSDIRHHNNQKQQTYTKHPN